MLRAPPAPLKRPVGRRREAVVAAAAAAVVAAAAALAAERPAADAAAAAVAAAAVAAQPAAAGEAASDGGTAGVAGAAAGTAAVAADGGAAAPAAAGASPRHPRAQQRRGCSPAPGQRTPEWPLRRKGARGWRLLKEAPHGCHQQQQQQQVVVVHRGSALHYQQGPSLLQPPPAACGGAWAAAAAVAPPRQARALPPAMLPRATRVGSAQPRKAERAAAVAGAARRSRRCLLHCGRRRPDPGVPACPPGPAPSRSPRETMRGARRQTRGGGSQRRCSRPPGCRTRP